MRHLNVTSVLHARSKHTTLISIANSLFEVLCPIVSAKLMTTQQLNRLSISLSSKISITNNAIASILRRFRIFRTWIFLLSLHIQLQATLNSQLCFLVKPFWLKLVSVPFEVAKHHDCLVVWETEHVLYLGEKRALTFFDFIDIADYIALLNSLSWELLPFCW